jgi:protoporphyrinogen oxidase
MVSKVWTDPDSLDPAFVSQRFAQIEPVEVIKKLVFPKQELNPATFYYPRLGFQQLWDRLGAYLVRHGQALQYAAEPLSIEARGGRIVRVTARTAAGETVYEGPDLTVVSTIPLAQLTRLLSGIGDEDELRRKARDADIRSMVLVAFELAQERTLPYRTLIFPEREFCFNRLFEQNEYSRDTIEAGKSVIVADITLRRDDPELRASDDHFIERARADLARLGYVASDRITDATVKRVEYAYVIPDRRTRSRFHEVLHALKALPNLITLGRFGAGEYDNSDYALDTGITVGAMLSGRLTQGEYLLHMQAKRGRHILG